MKLMWNKNKTHAIVRKQIREFVIIDNLEMERTDLMVKSTNGANIFMDSFANATEAQEFIMTAIKDLEPQNDAPAPDANDPGADDLVGEGEGN